MITSCKQKKWGCEKGRHQCDYWLKGITMKSGTNIGKCLIISKWRVVYHYDITNTVEGISRRCSWQQLCIKCEQAHSMRLSEMPWSWYQTLNWRDVKRYTRCVTGHLGQLLPGCRLACRLSTTMMLAYRWPSSVRLQDLLCLSNEDTAVLHKAIDIMVVIRSVYHIEAEIKRQPFCRRHYKCKGAIS